MKYFFPAFIFCLFSSAVFAQKVYDSPVYPADISFIPQEKAIPDTLFHNFFNLSPVLYPAPVGGWMNGTNAYGDKEKAQEVKFTQTYLLSGFIYWFALKDKNTGGDTSSIIFKYYKKDSAEIIMGQPRLVPGTVLAADTVKLGDINADTTFSAGLNLFTLPQPVVNFQNYVASFAMDLMHPNDTIALYSSTDEQVNITDYSWEKWNGKWNTIKNAWTLDVDFAIFPVIDLTGANVDESSLPAVKIYPNPASDFVQISGYSDEVNEFVLLNAEGKIIRSGRLSESQTSLSTEELPAGFYVLGLYDTSGKTASFFRFLKN